MTQTHDYTYRYWGHDYTVTYVHDDGQFISISGWGTGIKINDYIIIKNRSSTTRYQFTEIEYRIDPNDMWFGKARFAPREVKTND